MDGDIHIKLSNVRHSSLLYEIDSRVRNIINEYNGDADFDISIETSMTEKVGVTRFRI